MNLKKATLIALTGFAAIASHAQDNLVNSLSANASAKAKEKFEFSPVISLSCTDVKNQEAAAPAGAIPEIPSWNRK